MVDLVLKKKRRYGLWAMEGVKGVYPWDCDL